MTKDAAWKLMRDLMNRHGLHNWVSGFDEKAVKRFGQCDFMARRISISTKLVVINDESEVRNVILHEIAHALDYTRNRSRGIKMGHGPTWKAICVEIGARPERCYSSASVVQPEIKPRSRPNLKTATCARCGHKYTTLKARVCSCGRCSKKFDPTNLLNWIAA